MRKTFKVLFVLVAMMLVFVALPTQAFAFITEVDVTTPGVFTSPTSTDTFTGGQTITVNWGSSTADSSWGVDYYLSFYDGSSWITVANNIENTTYDYTLPDETSNQAQFRVYASVLPYGGETGSSNYRYSDVFSVTQMNIAPSVPGAFTTPAGTESVVRGSAMDVAWGSATDANGDELKYELSIYNGTDWSVVRDVVAATAADTSQNVTIPNVETTEAKFRTRAYDGAEFSDYAISNAFTIAASIPEPSTTPTPTPTSTPSGQLVSITGTLLDSEGKPLAGYTVELHSTPTIVVTDASGNFSVSGVTIGDHMLIVKNSGGATLGTFALKIIQGSEFSWSVGSNGDTNITVGQSTVTLMIEISISEESEVAIDGIADIENPSTGDSGLSWWWIAMIATLFCLGVVIMLKRKADAAA